MNNELNNRIFQYKNNLKHKNILEGLKEHNEIYNPKNFIQLLPFMDEVQAHKYYKYYEKLWNNESLTDKTLFIFFYRCGYGDSIMYSRYIPMLQKQAGKIIIEVHENLFDLYKYNFPKCEIVKEQKSEVGFDYDYTYHSELFLNFQKDFENFTKSNGYLKADKNLIKKYSNIFNTSKKKVGVFLQAKNDPRSMPEYAIADLLRDQKCQFYDLSCKMTNNSVLKEIYQKYNVIELGQYINNTHDTAAMMKNLDLVISIDSFPIHLAGALGIKAYLMLNYHSDWRWFYDTKTTPWYDSVRIFKQSYPDDWYGVVNEVSSILKKEFL